jgi:ribosomal protein L21E
MSNPKLFTALCQNFNLPEPVAEFQFAKDIKRRWRIDWYFHEPKTGKKVALEVEGGVWTGGRHTRGKGFVGDMEKYNEMAARGIALVRVQPKDLFKISTFETVLKALYA